MSYDLNKRAELNEKSRGERLADYRARIAALEAERDRLREALEHSAQMHDARANWIREATLKWNDLSVATGRSARAHVLASAADDEAATAESCRQALQPKEQQGVLSPDRWRKVWNPETEQMEDQYVGPQPKEQS